jgi:pimeloyl-ACP methyl ester carboxylesterase
MRESNTVHVSKILPEIKCPIFAPRGRDDVITPLAKAFEYFERFNIQLNIINQCGHSPMYEKPEEFASLVNSCLMG